MILQKIRVFLQLLIFKIQLAKLDARIQEFEIARTQQKASYEQMIAERDILGTQLVISCVINLGY